MVLQTSQMTEALILVTSEPPEGLDALEVTGLYRFRWQVEMFFRWLKCLVPCRHWFAESLQGVTIQIYLCLIKALLLAEHTGRKPNKRMMDDEELMRLLAAEELKRQRAAAKKNN